jgi:hypothetical protein
MTKILCWALFSVSALLAPVISRADSGWWVGNGGNPDALAFAKSALAAIRVLQNDPADYPQIQGINLEEILENTKVLVSVSPLTVTDDGITQRVAARIFPSCTRSGSIKKSGERSKIR